MCSITNWYDHIDIDQTAYSRDQHDMIQILMNLSNWLDQRISWEDQTLGQNVSQWSDCDQWSDQWSDCDQIMIACNVDHIYTVFVIQVWWFSCFQSRIWNLWSLFILLDAYGLT